jgi:hypothetical protein
VDLAEAKAAKAAASGPIAGSVNSTLVQSSVRKNTAVLVLTYAQAARSSASIKAPATAYKVAPVSKSLKTVDIPHSAKTASNDAPGSTQAKIIANPPLNDIGSKTDLIFDQFNAAVVSVAMRDVEYEMFSDEPKVYFILHQRNWYRKKEIETAMKRKHIRYQKPEDRQPKDKQLGVISTTATAMESSHPKVLSLYQRNISLFKKWCQSSLPGNQSRHLLQQSPKMLGASRILSWCE